MGKVSLTTYTLVVFLLATSCYAELGEVISCSKHQTAFDGACYEFVGLQFSFLRAEGWCERGGGHLVFILNDETQQFLQTHLDALSFLFLFCCFFPPGSLAWLDGSDVSYSNWVNLPEARATCGYILRDTGFQWTATENCTQELNFICQFGMLLLHLHCFDFEF
uniref:C-type lectin domain-containing protein n=1 Tax=Poecilia reticulata TaxID=8081 RepID=A0A3P9QJ80_POERE